MTRTLWGGQTATDIELDHVSRADRGCCHRDAVALLFNLLGGGGGGVHQVAERELPHELTRLIADYYTGGLGALCLALTRDPVIRSLDRSGAHRVPMELQSSANAVVWFDHFLPRIIAGEAFDTADTLKFKQRTTGTLPSAAWPRHCAYTAAVLIPDRLCVCALCWWTGICESRYDFGLFVDRHLQVMDTGGMRGERKKWIHCAEHVDLLLFCVALSEYDMGLWEDESCHRMHEALRYWEQVSATKWFPHNAVRRIVVFTKFDAFRAKIAAVPLSVCWSECKSPPAPDPSDSVAFDQFVSSQYEVIRDKFKAADRTVPGPLCTQYIALNATDPQSAEFSAFVDVIRQITASTQPRSERNDPIE